MDTSVCPQCKATVTTASDHRCSNSPTDRESAVPTVLQDPKKSSPSATGSPAPPKAPRAPRAKGESSAARAGEEAPSNLPELARDPTKVILQYVLVGMLGQGGMGQVWKAWDTKLSRWTALKFLTLTDESSRKRFEREARLAARLRHPHVCAVYEVGEHQGRHFIAMEFVDGVSLGKANLSIREAADVISKIARALEEAHRQDVIHRDLKPDNLMITKAGRPYVMDFGLAKVLEAESSLSVSGDVMGTPVFMSPEQARGEVDKIDARTDVYSLGATLYTLLTGQKPFQGKTSMEIVLKVVNQEPAPPRSLKPEIPAALEAIVRKAMEKDPGLRYPTAIGLAEDLERFLADEEVEARPPSLSRRVAVRLRRNPWPAALALVLAGGLGIGLAARGGAPGSEWLASFREQRHGLEYREWKPQGAAAAQVGALLDRLDNQPAESAREAVDWMKKEIELAEKALELWTSRPKSEWSKFREPALRASGWSSAAGGVLRGRKGEFAALSARLEETRRSADRLAHWRGEFALRIAVVPFGEVTALKRDGEPVALKDRETPLVLPELEIGNYEIDLRSGAHPPLHFSIPASRLRDGVTSTLVGDLRKPPTVQLVP